MSGWIFLAYLLLAMQVAAVVIALVARFWALTPEPVVLRGIDVPRASEGVALHIQGVHDHRFGFPTGMFFVSPAGFNASRGAFTAQEMNLRGSVGFDYMRRMFFLLPIAGGRAFGWWGAAIGFAVGIWVGGFFAVLAVMEIVYRWILRSRIDVSVRPHPELADAVTVSLAFRGLSAYGVQQGLLVALRPAQLPARLRPPAPAEEERRAPRPKDRFQAVYGGGVAAAVLVALVLALAAGTQSGGDDSYSRRDEPDLAAAGDDSSGGGQVEESEGSVPEEPPPDEPEPDEPAAPATRRVTQADLMERVVRRHWNNRLEGDASSLRQAYEAYGPPLKQRAGVFPRWLDGIRADGLRDIEISHLEGKLTGRGTGRVDMDVRTESDERPCVDWDIRYTMRRGSGRWLIWDSTATDTDC
ncbi:MAG TPA: hypothetical protein VF529_09365 [Solirubrobacteraceae bacterium]|jgi:hypothetical protein